MAVILKKKFVGIDEPRPVRFNLADIRAEAHAILEQARSELAGARTQAHQIIQQASAEAEEIKRKTETQARENGYHEGYEKGQAEGRRTGHDQALEESRKQFTEQTSQLQQALQALLTDFDRRRHDLISEAHQDLLGLAVAMAEKIVRTRIEVDPPAVLNLVRSAVDLLASRTAVRIRMNPIDLEALKLLDGQEAERVLGLQDVAFVGDEAVERGGCVIATEGGEVDARIATQIDALVRHIVPAMSEKIKSWQARSEDGGKTDPHDAGRAGQEDNSQDTPRET